MVVVVDTTVVTVVVVATVVVVVDTTVVTDVSGVALSLLPVHADTKSVIANTGTHFATPHPFPRPIDSREVCRWSLGRTLDP